MPVSVVPMADILYTYLILAPSEELSPAILSKYGRKHFFPWYVWIRSDFLQPCMKQNKLCNLFNIMYILENNLSIYCYIQFSSVQSLTHVQLFATPWIAACQASLSITISQSSLKFTYTDITYQLSKALKCVINSIAAYMWTACRWGLLSFPYLFLLSLLLNVLDQKMVLIIKIQWKSCGLGCDQLFKLGFFLAWKVAVNKPHWTYRLMN